MTNAVTPTVAVRHPSEVQAALTFEQVSDPDASALAHPHTGRAAEAGGAARLFPHVHPHVTRHTLAMATLERLVRGYYQQAAQLAVDAGGDDALALYLTKADPLLVLRDLLGHASAATTQAFLHQPSGIASAGRETAGQQFTAGSG